MQFDGNDDFKIAAADPCEKTSFPTMIQGILAKHILPDSTVLGFTRSGHLVNREILKNKAEIFSFVDLTEEDVEAMINQVIEKPEQRELILECIRSIDRELQKQILFVKEIMKLSLRGRFKIEVINSRTDLFLSIILGNLQYQNPEGKTGYSELLSDHKENLKKTFQVCKISLQKNDELSAGAMKGDKVEDQNWECQESGIEIPLMFLEALGTFEVPPADVGEVILTAGHLSFVEFMAAAGILLSSDIKSELDKIENEERFKAVTVYMR